MQTCSKVLWLHGAFPDYSSWSLPPVHDSLQSAFEIQSSLGFCRGLVPGLPWTPKSSDAHVPYKKWPPRPWESEDVKPQNTKNQLCIYWKNPHISGAAQFKSMLFKVRLCLLCPLYICIAVILVWASHLSQVLSASVSESILDTALWGIPLKCGISYESFV